MDRFSIMKRMFSSKVKKVAKENYRVATIEVEHALERPAEAIADARVNRAKVLGKLGRFGEAKAELEDCLSLFENNPAASAQVLSSLAHLFDQQGDLAQAITQVRRALAVCEQLPDPADRARSHQNLAIYLEQIGSPSVLAEGLRHKLAALIYLLIVGMRGSAHTVQINYAIDFCRAEVAGTVLVVPRVAALLADPAFAPLEQWLRQRQVDVAQLQAAVDEFLEKARVGDVAPPEP